jgi:hypothetical protein
MRSHVAKASAIIVGLLVALGFIICLPVGAHEGNLEPLYLTVKLNDIYNPDLRMTLPVRAGKPFKVTVENSDLKTTISGTLSDPVEGKYPLTITISEWASTTNNIAGTSELHLELDKPLAWGPVFSVVYLRTVQLSSKRPT